MTRAEAGLLLTGLGLRPPTSTCSCSARRAGPPASISRRSSLQRAAGSRPGASPRFAGDDRLVADYLRDELLADLPRDRLSFLTRTSVLDGPLRPAVRRRARPAGLGRDAARARPIESHARPAGPQRTAATATTACSRTCCRRSCAGSSRRPRPRCTGARARGTPVAGRSSGRSTTPSRRARSTCAGDLLWGVAAGYVTDGRHAMIRRWLGSLHAGADRPPCAARAGRGDERARDRRQRPRRALVRGRRRAVRRAPPAGRRRGRRDHARAHRARRSRPDARRRGRRDARWCRTTPPGLRSADSSRARRCT